MKTNKIPAKVYITSVHFLWKLVKCDYTYWWIWPSSLGDLENHWVHTAVFWCAIFTSLNYCHDNSASEGNARDSQYGMEATYLKDETWWETQNQILLLSQYGPKPNQIISRIMFLIIIMTHFFPHLIIYIYTWEHSRFLYKSYSGTFLYLPKV